MNEFETEDIMRERASRSYLAARKRASNGMQCEICNVTNPHLLEQVKIERDGGDLHDAHLCRNHARFLFTRKKRLSDVFDEKSDRNTVPGILIDEEWLAFQARRIQNSTLFTYPDIPYTNRLALRDRDLTIEGIEPPQFQPYDKLKAIVRKHMKIAPFSPHPDCACAVCGEARPIMIEVHHVDRERNSDRAVFLCLNHHVLITLDQEYEQPDDQSIENLDVRAEYATAIGTNGLLNLIYNYRAALSKRVPDRHEHGRSFFDNFHAPVEDVEVG